MKKKLYLILIAVLSLCCALTLLACNKEQVATPNGLEIDTDTLVLSWNKVQDARFYTVKISGPINRTQRSSQTEISLTQLPAGQYRISVQATGRGELEPSDWSSSIPFVREQENGMAFVLINNKQEYEVIGKGTATGDIVVPDLYRGKPVTSIGYRAFYNKPDVTSVKLGKNIVSIGEQAFANSATLGSIDFNEENSVLTTIGKRAFHSCAKLTEVDMPDTVTTVGAEAFGYCRKMERITLSSNLSALETGLFSHCESLTEIDIPDGVSEIQADVFAVCSSLSQVTIGDSVTSIGDNAFRECEILTEIVIPDSVTSIGEQCFHKSAALVSVTLGSGLRTVSSSSFLDTAIWNNASGNVVTIGEWLVGVKDKKTAATVPTAVKGIADGAFSGYSGASVVELPANVRWLGASAFAGSTVSNFILGPGVETIGANAFNSCVNLTTIILGGYDYTESTMTSSSLVSIGEYAFRGCKALATVDIPSSVKSIGTYAFHETALFENAADGIVYAGNWLVGFDPDKDTTYLTVKQGTVGIANYAFYNNKTLVSVVLPNTVKYLGRAAFYQSAMLSTVTLPSTLEVIEDYTFYKCTRLSGITLPDTLKRIGRSAFYKCGLASDSEKETDNDTLVIPNAVTEIGDYAFYGCGIAEDGETFGIDNLVIGASVRSIGQNAFYNFVSLKKVTFLDSVNGIDAVGEKAFYKCEALEEVVFNNTIETIGNRAFYKCTSLKSLVFPDNVKKIEEYAFYRCYSLASVDFGGVTDIGDYAFYGCGIEGLAFRETVERVGKQAFRNNKSLKSLVLAEDGPEIGAHAFYGCDEMTVYTDAMKRPDQWAESWNSTYRPVIWGCELSVDGTYVVSVTIGQITVENKNSSNELSSPCRLGYDFEGWTYDMENEVSDVTTEQLLDESFGTTLYAIWIKVR